MSSQGKIILDSTRFALTIERLCCQLMEDCGDFTNTCLIGLQPRGIYLARLVRDYLRQQPGMTDFEYGELDITFYRDDFRMHDQPLVPHVNNINFLVASKKVILVDDVLYTGRSIQAAMTALQHYGRPQAVELLVLIDRRFNRHLPVQADYIGLSVDALDEAYVRVNWGEQPGNEQVLLFDKKNNSPT